MNEWPSGWSQDDRGVSRTRYPQSPPSTPTAVLPQTPTGPRQPRRPQLAPSRRWPRRLLRTVAVVVVLLLIAAIGGSWYFNRYVNARLERVPALIDYPGRPANTRGETWLVVGSDNREGLSSAERRALRTGDALGHRADTMILLHFPGGGGQPTLVSLPRDSYVNIPAHIDENGRRHSAHKNKLNAAFSLGGPQLLARTVEQATDLRLDHYMEIGFGGFVSVVDAIGGVELCLDEAIKDRKSGADLPAGCQRLSGGQALSFVRSRDFDPRADLARIENQQKFLRALGAELSTLRNPFQGKQVLDASLAALTVDESTRAWDLFSLFRQLRRLAAGDGVTMSMPVADTSYRRAVGSTVLWDEDKSEELLDRLRNNLPVPVPDEG